MSIQTALTGLSAMALHAAIIAAPGIEPGEPDPTTGSFVPATVIERPELKYPPHHLARRHEGWVQLNYMVDRKGTPYDIVVSGSSDDFYFEAAAIEYIQETRFAPGHVEGRPVDASSMSTISFTLGSNGLTADDHSLFRKRYRETLIAIKAGDQDAAKTLMDQMRNDNHNLYENVYYHLAEYSWEARWGTTQGQYQALHLATINDQTQAYLPTDLLRKILLQKLRLQAPHYDLAPARRTINRILELEPTDEEETALAQVSEEVEEFIASTDTVSVPITIGHHQQYFHALVRSSFRLDEIQGEVLELRVHCDRGYAIFTFAPQMRYSINPDWQSCGLVVGGVADTKLIVIET